MNPLDEYAMRKESGFWGDFTAGKGIGGDVRTAVIGTGVAAATAGIVPAVKRIMGAITKRHDFNMMLEHNPDLRDAQRQNPKLFNQAYTSLRSMNPQFAADPLVAGGLMSRIMVEPTAAHQILRDSYMANRPSASPMQQAMVGAATKGLFDKDTSSRWRQPAKGGNKNSP